MKVCEEELTPEELEFHRQRGLIKSQLRGDCKAANEGKVLCTYCRAELSQSRTRLSYIVPPAQGGKTELDNMVLSCCSCANSKHGRTLREWAERLNDQLDVVHALITRQARKEASAA